jgi:murein DD-endopeptidase MepM/ murein hydrolase activator NlpD
MPVRLSSPRFLSAAFLILVVASVLLQGADGIKVTHRVRSLQPGEVVVFKAEFPERMEKVFASAFGKTFPFYELQGNIWEGLVGIDLGVKQGEHQVKISGNAAGDRSVATSVRIEVLAKEFPVRRLTVEKKYVSPPEEELKRIRAESKRVSSIFAEVSAQKHWDGPFLRPVPGEAISSFGKRSIINGQPRSPHTGTDFRAGKGTPIKAPAAGKVMLVKDLYFAGNTVIVDHGLGLFSYFAHLSVFKVSEGQFVEAGEVVGEVGATGRVTGPHLHWTLRLAETRVDPLSLMAVLQEEARDSE